MRFTTAVRVSVLLAVFAVPADALGAGTVRTSSVTGRLVVPAGRAGTISLHCPPGAVALNAAVTRQGSGVVVRRSVPGAGAGDWAFRVAAAGSGSRSVSAALRCVALRLPNGLMRAHVDVRTRDRSGIALAPGATASTRLGCGRSWTATGYALKGDGAVRLARVTPEAHGWRFTLENTGTSTALAGVSVRCLASKVTAERPGGGSAELRFAVSRRSFSTALPPGPGEFEASACSPGRFSLAAGGELDAASSRELITASPGRQRRGRWTFAGGAAGDQFTGHVVCLGTGSTFR